MRFLRLSVDLQSSVSSIQPSIVNQSRKKRGLPLTYESHDDKAVN